MSVCYLLGVPTVSLIVAELVDGVIGGKILFFCYVIRLGGRNG